MAKTNIEYLNEFGQSVWLDAISRSLIESGALKKLISAGLRGMTSNPAIFNNAIAKTGDYDAIMKEMLDFSMSAFDIYDELTIKDIRDACDIFKDVFQATGMLDGYVSLEIDPRLAYDTVETIKEGRRLFKKVDRPNLMLKVPATEEGFKAIEEFISTGFNVNATLIFSLEQYIKTQFSYLNGLKRLIKRGGDAGKVRSVASVFVSRIDTSCDRLIDENLKTAKDDTAKERLLSLKGRAAFANSARIYSRFLEFFYSDYFLDLKKDHNANIQRLLWASTGTKNPEYSDIKYVSELIGKDSINTMPMETFNNFIRHGEIKKALPVDIKTSQSIVDRLKEYSIDVDMICDALQKDGVKSFIDSFNSLLSSIKEKTSLITR